MRVNIILEETDNALDIRMAELLQTKIKDYTGKTIPVELIPYVKRPDSGIDPVQLVIDLRRIIGLTSDFSSLDSFNKEKIVKVLEKTDLYIQANKENPVESAQTYTSVPTEIEAIQYVGNNQSALHRFGVPTQTKVPEGSLQIWVAANAEWLTIQIGEWVAKDQIGFYPIKDEIFKKKYRKAE